MSNLDNMMNDVPEINKGTSKRTKTTIDAGSKNIDIDFSQEELVDLVTERKKKREALSVYFDSDVMDKLKTISMSTKPHTSISKIVENLVCKVFADVEIDKQKVKKYDSKKK